MSINLFKDKGTKLENQRFTWKPGTELGNLNAIQQ